LQSGLQAKPATGISEIVACGWLASGAVYPVDNDPDPIHSRRKNLIVLITAGVITWIIGMCIHSLILVVLGGSLAVSAACGMIGRFD